MKKFYLIIALFFVTALGLKAQPLKFKVGLIDGPSSNSLDIVIRPNVNFTGYPTNVIFILQIPQGIPQPTITKTSLSPYFVFTTDLSTLPNEGGYTTYGFAASNASNTSNAVINAGQNYPILRLTFTGVPLSTTDIRVSHLANGGASSLYQNYVEVNAVVPASGVADYTDYVQMFFGTIVEPNAPYGDEGTGYSSYQYTQKSQVLPVNWLSFTAIKQGDNALLNWKVTNEDKNHHFEVLRSNDAVNFSSIAIINKSGINNGSYNYTDAGINSLRASVLYYRIRQVDLDGKTGYSDIKNISLSEKDYELKIYPNPVTKGFYVDMNLSDADQQGKINLKLFSSNGQFITSKEITTLQAANYYFDITDVMLAAGQYNLQVIVNDRKLASKMITVVH